MAHARAQVEDQLLGGFPQQHLQRIAVGFGQVQHMDVIAQAGAVRRIIVGAIDLETGALAQGGLTGDLDQMRGLGRRLADAALRVSPCHVEIAQRHILEPIGGERITQHPLRHQLRSAIG